MAGYSLGVDLGTTFTAAATVDETGVPIMVGLGNRAMQIPSVVHIGSDGSTMVGELAERQAAADPISVAREFKRRMGDAVPIYVGSRPFTAEALNAALLRWVIEQTTERMGGPPSHVTLTHPASWTQFNVGRLAEAAELAGVVGVTMRSEPVAAATHYACNNAVAVGDRICIYDLGGGTFDVCVVVKTEDGFEILGNPCGVENVGGIDFDKEIIQSVHRGISTANPGLDPDDPGYAALRRECVDAKEALSVDVNTVIPVALTGLSTSYRLTRGELESMIDTAIDSTITATRSALKSAGLSPSDLSALVLVGGSSRIPLVSQKLANAFKCRLAMNTHPKHEVALGAAMAGAPKPPAELTLHPPLRRSRSTQGRRKALLSVSGVAVSAILAMLVVGRYWPLPTASAQSTVSTPSTVSAQLEISSSDTDVSTSVQTTAMTRPTSTATDLQTAAQLSTPPPTPTTSPVETTLPESTVAAPDSLDQASVAWFRMLCGGGARMKAAMVVPGTMYQSVRAAQQAYVDSFGQRADIARATADALELSQTELVAGGRVDAQTAVEGFRRLANILDDGSQFISDATVVTVPDLTAAVAAVGDQIEQGYQPADMQFLSAAEMGFVKALDGCQSLGD